MITRIMDVSTEPMSMHYIKEASEILRNGGLVAFPTETVYGLGGDATWHTCFVCWDVCVGVHMC